ncbi:hypothetical protein [Plantactinospora mayteni]|uniref:hypothetical protein n=1 Tax=Plantactinospora mayteni TaxID=566021 RepID=UPI001944AE35|nr:hypothetical protein [Plantactinospora mayteni]
MPFLVRLAQDPRTTYRDGSLHLLTRIADAVDEGPQSSCWGQDYRSQTLVLFRAAGKALVDTNVAGWFDLLDDVDEPDRRRDVLRILATVNRCDRNRLLGRLWESVLAADDVERLVERLICLAYANAERSHLAETLAEANRWWGSGRPDSWVLSLRDWLEAAAFRQPSPERTTEAVRIALDHLPEWIDAETVQALGELVSEELPRLTS